MKRIFTFLLALVMALGMFPIQAIPVHATETEEPMAEKPAAAAKSDLEATIEKQIRAFAKSINKKDADDAAAWELAQHGMLGRGKKMSVGKSHALTAALMNSELAQKVLIDSCEAAIRSMQQLDLDRLEYVRGHIHWGGTADNFYFMRVYSSADQPRDKYDWALCSFDRAEKWNEYDESLTWMGGGVSEEMSFKRSKITADSVTYQVALEFKDRFDFSISGNDFFKDLISGIGVLLFKEFDWSAKVTFDLTVPYTCYHESQNYRFTYDAESKTMTSDNSGSWQSNDVARRIYTYNDTDSYYYELAETVRLRYDAPWVMEFDARSPNSFGFSPFSETNYSYPVLHKNASEFLYVCNYEMVKVSQNIKDEYGLTNEFQQIRHYYGTSLNDRFIYKTYTFRLENELCADGSNMIYLTVRETDTGTVVLDRIPMDDYYYYENWTMERTLIDENNTWLSGKDLIINYIGYTASPFSASHFELRIWENGQDGEPADYFKDKVTKATCDKKGYTTHTCELCGYSYKDTYVDAPGHTWDDGVVTKEPSEETAGVLTYTCVTCGETKTEELPILEHTHRYEETVTAPTCTGQGYTTYTCTCGDSYVDAYVEALGHNLSDWIEVVAPTCTQKGSERRACANCDHSEEQDLEATGHHYQSTVIAPTFTKRGYTEYVCSNCDERYVEEESYTDPLGLPKPVVKAAQNKTTGGGILIWEADREADSYKIYRATSSKGKYSLYKTVTEPTATVSVPVGKTYCFKVKAICEEDSTLSSPYSSIVKVTGKCAQPKVTVSNNTSGYPVIKWSKVTSAKKYWVYRATSENGKYTRVTITTKLSYTDTKATTGKTYFYKVKAVASKSTYNGAYSEIVNCLKKLSKPTITLTTSQTKGTITVKWKKVTGATGYELQRKVNSGEYETVKTGTVLSYTDKNVEPGNKYTYRLKAMGSREELNNGYSSVKSAAIKAGKPSVSIKLAKNKPSLSWKETEGAVKYQVYYATSKYGKYKLLKTTEDLTYTYTSAKKGKTYYFKVRAVDQNGTAGDYSTVKSIKSK